MKRVEFHEFVRTVMQAGFILGIFVVVLMPCWAQGPIRGTRKDEIISRGYMETNVVLSRSGRLTIQTHSWTKNKSQGFHGILRVIICCNATGDCYVTPEIRCGVAGTWDPSGPSNRTCVESFEVPLDIAATADSCVISHGKNTVPIWDNPIVKRGFDQAGRLYREHKEDVKEAIKPAVQALTAQ